MHSHADTWVQPCIQPYPHGSPWYSVVMETLGNNVVILVPPVITLSKTDSEISHCYSHSCACVSFNACRLSLIYYCFEYIWFHTVALSVEIISECINPLRSPA